MGSSRLWVGGVVALLQFAMAGNPTQANLPAGAPRSVAKERARIALSQSLPKLDGNHLKATAVEVTYGPGESSQPHSHPCAVIGYVVEGLLRTQVKGEPQAICKPGETFYEAPNGIHVISANASQTEPARFIAFFVCDRDAPLSSDAPEITKPGGK
jgi:quercetin dioxygenase-like cupin family protein